MSALGSRRKNEGPVDQVMFDVNRSSQPEQLENKLRPVFVKQNLSQQASGSSYLEVGNTKILALVHGPMQYRKEFQTQAEVEVYTTIPKFSGIRHTDDTTRAISDFVRSSVTSAIVLKDYPKSVIAIELRILNGVNGAELTASCVNACILALVNAGITLHDMVTAVSVSEVDNQLYIDSSLGEDYKDEGELVAVYSPLSGKLVSFLITSTNEIPLEKLENLIELSKPAAIELRSTFAEMLLEDYSKQA